MNQFSALRLKQITSTSVLISAVSAFALLGVAILPQVRLQKLSFYMYNYPNHRWMCVWAE